jgi:hypothetical protein
MLQQVTDRLVMKVKVKEVSYYQQIKIAIII